MSKIDGKDVFRITGKQTMPDEKPYVSVVIPTYNRSGILPLCLDSLFNQTYPKDCYEIIIINDGSKDNTEDVLREFEKKAPCDFIWASQKNQGITRAENFGLSKAKGAIVCFTADDCITDKNWILHLVNGFITDTIGAVGGKVVSYQIITPIQQFIEDSGVLDQETFAKRNTLITGNAAYWRHILITIGGFDSHLNACEDLDISIKTQRLGYTLRFIPDAIVQHDHPATVKGFFSQQYRNAIGYVRLHRKYGQKYDLAYCTSIYWGRILGILIRYPFTLVSALVSRKKKYFVLKPLYYVIYYSAFSWGIIRETLWGEEYRGYPVQSRIDFMGFMEDKPISSLWEMIIKKVRKYP